MTPLEKIKQDAKRELRSCFEKYIMDHHATFAIICRRKRDGSGEYEVLLETGKYGLVNKTSIQ